MNIENENSDILNELKCSIDWLEFTVFDHTLVYLLDKLGYNAADFIPLAKGAIGYRNMMRHSIENIYVYYNGNKDMGIHVKITGSSVMYSLQAYVSTISVLTPFGTIGYYIDFEKFNSFLPAYIEFILSIGRFTRIDLAIDDIGCRYFSCSDVLELLKKNLCVSKFRSYQTTERNSISDNSSEGMTVYFGSRTSDVMLRLYDKGKEQKVDYEWYRWELEIKHDKADMIAQKIIQADRLGAVAIGLLSNYVRFIEYDATRRERCSMHPVWSRFVKDVETIGLTLQKGHKTVEDKEDWIKRQCLPTIAGLAKYYQGDMAFLYGNLQDHYMRLSAANRALFSGGGPKG